MELSPFKQAIKEHLVLRAQNSVLDAEMPLAGYRSEEISANHAVFEATGRYQPTPGCLPAASYGQARPPSGE